MGLECIFEQLHKEMSYKHSNLVYVVYCIPHLIFIIGLNFYFVIHVIHTISIHTSVKRIWSKTLSLVLTISTNIHN